MFAYDITSRASLDELTVRYDELLEYFLQLSPVSPVMILGLKLDLENSKREVPREALSTFAAGRGCLTGECSALTGQGVDEAFSEIIEGVHHSRVFIKERDGKAS